MKASFLATTSIIAMCATPLFAEQLSDYVPEARQHMMQLGKTLKGELQKAMKSGGSSEAIGVCNTKAPEITAQVSTEAGWDVGRTSLKLRNPDNQPDAWEQQVLESFETRKAAGEDPQKLDYAEILQTPEGKTFRYMKAIPTEAVCLICHGSEIDAKTEKELKNLYPEDQATGFSLGDIRGAFTLKKAL